MNKEREWCIKMHEPSTIVLRPLRRGPRLTTASARLPADYRPGRQRVRGVLPTTVVQSRTFQLGDQSARDIGVVLANASTTVLGRRREQQHRPIDRVGEGAGQHAARRAPRMRARVSGARRETAGGVRGRRERMYRRAGSAWRTPPDRRGRIIEEMSGDGGCPNFSRPDAGAVVRCVLGAHARERRCATATSSSTPRAPRRAPPSSAPRTRPYSHVGLVLHRDGKPYVFEAIATVRYTPLAHWTARGTGGDYVVKRLTAPLTTPSRRRAARRLRRTKNTCRQAELTTCTSNGPTRSTANLLLRAGLGGAGTARGIASWNSSARQKLREFDLSDPVVKAKMRERYGEDVPLDEPVISPAAMFDSGELVATARVMRAKAGSRDGSTLQVACAYVPHRAFSRS